MAESVVCMSMNETQDFKMDYDPTLIEENTSGESASDNFDDGQVHFSDFDLNPQVLRALDDVGYEVPSPIQEKMMPFVLDGRDVLGQAQTGTGKTAAFALPLLSRIDLSRRVPQVLVLAPTRELAIQVAEAFQKYASYLKGFQVLPIYGGQGYSTQLKQLGRGVHVIVGTPGRVMDHMRRGTLDLSNLSCLVLDEADEMLRMGFVDDVEWILEKTPAERQIALFSATMPKAIQRIAQRYLNNPEEVVIKLRSSGAETIQQRYLLIDNSQKVEALTRILETEQSEGVIVFVRTKNATVDLAEKLMARGYTAVAINGDIAQNQRERSIENLRSSKVDILVATDVAARGLDVERVSHVINYDIPYDTEAYVHRIGRTGRAGRSGDAILFVTPREKRMLYGLEKATKQKIEMMDAPSLEVINEKRVRRFKEQISETLSNTRLSSDLHMFRDLLMQYQLDEDFMPLDIAAALAVLHQGGSPLLLDKELKASRDKGGRDKGGRDSGRGGRDRGRDRDRGRGRDRDRDRDGRRAKGGRDNAEGSRDRDERGGRGEKRGKRGGPDTSKREGMTTFRLDVGHDHGVRPGNIVGAIANEADIDSSYIGHIGIFDDYSIVDLPQEMESHLENNLRNVRVVGRPLNFEKFTGKISNSSAKGDRDRSRGDKKFDDKKAKKKRKLKKSKKD